MKYIWLFLSFFRASLMADLEYRANLVVKVGTDVIWYIAQMSLFEVLFRHTDTISGWTLEMTRVFLGILFIGDGLWMVLFSENLDRLSEKVRRGDLDFLFVKPINSQFMISMRRMNTAYLGNVLLSFSWLFWALYQLPAPLPWARLLLLFILLPCSVMITYSLRFFFSATALIFTNAESINYVWYQLYRLGTRPDAIYPPWLRYFILTLFPIGFVASVPSRLILSAPDIALILTSIGVASMTLWLSTRYWRMAMKSYSSASS